jgi:dTDP-3-amino-3,6-dideoxy-alpha-D-glucopyranose N,N-dimethyltransferase/dTDP-3-amino-3,4,6-trideoxy-alpha-D-glucopyranose N,N-dimethyltransferase
MFRRTAHVYDLIYAATGKDYASESSELHRIVQTANPDASSLLDVACGTGGHLAHLREHFDVVGIDLDVAMLEVARARLDDVELVEADMRSFDLGRQFDAVVCLFSSIGYMTDAHELSAAIATMARHLTTNGVLVIDGWLRPDAWIEGGTTVGETAESADVKVARIARSQRSGSTTLLEMHHLIADVHGIEHVVDHHVLTLFTPEEYEHALTDAGLTVTVTASPMPGRDRYIATKP